METVNAPEVPGHAKRRSLDGLLAGESIELGVAGHPPTCERATSPPEPAALPISR